MQSGLYVALSGQIAMQRRMDTLAHNIANAGTAGFRAEEVTFRALVSRSAPEPVSFAGAGNTWISREGGAVTRTDNPLDVAVTGEGWLAVRTPQGPAYTRDGRMRLLETGMLETLNGYAVLDAGMAPIVLDPAAGEIAIARDGMISQNGRQAGAIGLFRLDPRDALQRADNSAVRASRPAVPILDFTGDGVLQGHVESANVNAMREMTRLIVLTRAFEAAASATQSAEGALQDAIKTLG